MRDYENLTCQLTYTLKFLHKNETFQHCDPKLILINFGMDFIIEMAKLVFINNS